MAATARSRVRHELALAFRGQPYPQDWLLADVLMDWKLREDAVHAFFRPDGLPLICFPMRAHRWRLTLPFAEGRNGRPVTLAEIQELTDQRAPVAVSLSDPSWLAAFRCHRRSTDCYRRGRVLLAGDAVHIHTPAGGQGLNTGIADAHNLAWKLALVASGRAPDVLLDSYGRERRPVADEVLKLTHALIRSGTVSHPVKSRARDIIVPTLARVPVIQRRAARRISQVYVSYPPSPLTGTGHRPARLGCWPGAGWAKPGQRVPDMRVRWGDAETTLHRVLRTGRHVLVLPMADAVVAGLRPYRAGLEIVTCTPVGARGSGRGSALVVLVRPDGYVAARGMPDRLQAVTGYLRDLLGNSPGAPRPAPWAMSSFPGLLPVRLPGIRHSSSSVGLAGVLSCGDDQGCRSVQAADDDAIRGLMMTRRLLRFHVRRPLAMLAALAAGLAAYAGTGAADPAAAAARPAAAQTAVVQMAGAQAAGARTAGTQAAGARAAGAQTAGAQAAGAPAGMCSSAAHSRMAAEVSRGIARALADRSSIAGITAYDPVTGIRCEYHQWWQFPSASVVKVIILGTLLHELQFRHEHLTTRQVTLTTAMITQSDNDAATALWDEVGMARLRYFLGIAKMDHTVLGQDGYWGLTAVNAHDEMLLLRLLVTRNSVLDGASRAYALSLMARVIRSQRWGVTDGARPDVRVHVKNGWLPVPTLWVVNSIGDFTHRHGGPYSIAILTSHNPDMAYGIETIQAVASQINRVVGTRP